MPEWLSSIEAGDWLGAAVNGLSILVAILLGIVFGPMIAEKGARRDKQEALLRTLVETWLTPALPSYSTAINLIPIEFRTAPTVMAQFQKYMKHVNMRPETPEALQAQQRATVEEQAKLIEAVAKHLGYEVTADHLLTQSYISSGYVERERLAEGAYRAWLRMAAALEAMTQPTAAPQQAADAREDAAQSSTSGEA